MDGGAGFLAGARLAPAGILVHGDPRLVELTSTIEALA